MYTISTDLIFNTTHILRNKDQANIPTDLKNTDYQKFLRDVIADNNCYEGTLSEDIFKDIELIKTAE